MKYSIAALKVHRIKSKNKNSFQVGCPKQIDLLIAHSVAKRDNPAVNPGHYIRPKKTTKKLLLLRTWLRDPKEAATLITLFYYQMERKKINSIYQ